MKSLAIAATGMNAQQTNVEVIANNIANINSTSYKRARAEFTDLFYQMDRMQGVANVNMIIEMADMREGNRSYEANLQVVKQVRSMLGMTIDLLRS